MQCAWHVAYRTQCTARSPSAAKGGNSRTWHDIHQHRRPKRLQGGRRPQAAGSSSHPTHLSICAAARLLDFPSHSYPHGFFRYIQRSNFHLFFQKPNQGTSPAVQGLGGHGFTAGSLGSIPGKGTRSPRATQCGAATKKLKVSQA